MDSFIDCFKSSRCRGQQVCVNFQTKAIVTKKDLCDVFLSY